MLTSWTVTQEFKFGFIHLYQQTIWSCDWRKLNACTFELTTHKVGIIAANILWKTRLTMQHHIDFWCSMHVVVCSMHVVVCVMHSLFLVCCLQSQLESSKLGKRKASGHCSRSEVRKGNNIKGAKYNRIYRITIINIGQSSVHAAMAQARGSITSL